MVLRSNFGLKRSTLSDAKRPYHDAYAYTSTIYEVIYIHIDSYRCDILKIRFRLTRTGARAAHTWAMGANCTPNRPVQPASHMRRTVPAPPQLPRYPSRRRLSRRISGRPPSKFDNPSRKARVGHPGLSLFQLAALAAAISALGRHVMRTCAPALEGITCLPLFGSGQPRGEGHVKV